MSEILHEIPLLDDILADWKETIGEDFEGYRNHVYRMVQFCWQLKDCSQEDKQKIIIAGAFHDIGIWVDQTLDYLPPSIPPAMTYLQANGLEDWSKEISLMITEHHKLRPYTARPDFLVELFRRGDLIDFSLGIFKQGVKPAFVREIKASIPNAGFHKMLVRRSLRWFVRHPLNPAPMMKW
jgi:hypothetical protein